MAKSEKDQRFAKWMQANKIDGKLPTQLHPSDSAVSQGFTHRRADGKLITRYK